MREWVREWVPARERVRASQSVGKVFVPPRLVLVLLPAFRFQFQSKDFVPVLLQVLERAQERALVLVLVLLREPES